MHPVGASNCAYLTRSSLASEEDLYLSFLNFVCQRLSFPETNSFVHAVEDDFHLLAVHAAKLEHFFLNRERIDSTLVSSFVRSEVEALLATARSVFDLSQEIVARIWNDRIRLNDEEADSNKNRNKLPASFRKVVLENNRVRTADRISEKYSLSSRMAEVYEKHSNFFCTLRRSRDLIVHGTKSAGHVFVTERGFAVRKSEQPFDDFNWQDFHAYNENLVSLKPWLAHVILETIEACSELVESLQSAAHFGGDLFPGYEVRLRDPANKAIVELLNAASEDLSVSKAAAFWA
ncbi:hypothetical protein [Phaeobacter italicus]|nr:hypothetical protein [Phaeobacter italicus]CRL14970.1 hypothetical protein NIT7645_02011 [Phaeobacter italicus]SFG93017.1 hypothetical protein SAMN04488019_1057 [Phaeobacter italicus]